MARIEQGRAWLRDLGFVGERKALSLLPLCLFGFLYLVLSLNAQPGWGPAMFGLSLCYLTAFFALAAGWFWARWFASGLGWSGTMVGLMSLVMFGYMPVLAIYLGLHALVVVALMGPKMASRYEQRDGWRERFSLDEFGVARLGKAVTRGAGALPTLILWALAPRTPESLAAHLDAGVHTTVWVALAFTVLALVGFARLRGYAVLALGGATLAAALGWLVSSFDGAGLFAGADVVTRMDGTVGVYAFVPAVLPIAATLFLAAAFFPLLPALVRHMAPDPRRD